MASSSGPTAWLGASDAACCDGGGSACRCANRNVISCPSREAGGLPFVEQAFGHDRPARWLRRRPGRKRNFRSCRREFRWIATMAPFPTTMHELAVRFAPRFGGKSHFGIHFQHIGQRGDFLACRVIQRARRRKISGIARRRAVRRRAGRRECSAAAARKRCRTIPRAPPSDPPIVAGPRRARAAPPGKPLPRRCPAS